jgi:transcriptional regulator with XRE-family HTH domain
MEIGKRLYELRQAKGLSVADLEARTGVPQNHIAAVEEGKETPTVDALEAWAGGLGVEMYQLFLVGKRSLSPPQRDSVGTLTVREKKLVRLFRSLSPADQRDLLFIGRKMAGLEPKAEGRTPS